jgi:glycosyltransferase involved in cell wall biosynthesis
MAKAGSLGRWAARQADVPHVVHTFHGHVLQDYFSPPVNRAFISLERFLARKTDVLVAVSEAIRDELLDLGIGRRDQWRVVPLGLDLEALLEDLPDRAESRSTMGLPTEGPIVGIVGRLVPIKEHPLFFRAAARIARERPDIHFVVAGDGELRSTLENEARSLLSDKVTFLGWVDDLPALYSALDVVVLTSRNEGTPVALIEAAAAGRPAVATDVGGVGDVVLHGKTGCLVAPGDEDALARSIIGSLDPIVGAALGRAGREHVADRFSSRRLVHDIAALYDDLLRRPV